MIIGEFVLNISWMAFVMFAFALLNLFFVLYEHTNMLFGILSSTFMPFPLFYDLRDVQVTTISS